MDKAEYSAFMAELASEGGAYCARLVRGASKEPTVFDAMLRILTKASMSARVSRLGDREASATLHETLRRFIASGMPMTLVLPLGGGKVPSPLKTGGAILPDASEWVAGLRLHALARALEHFHASDVRVLLVPDAPLHTADMGFGALDTEHHLRVLRADFEELGIADRVIVDWPGRWVGPRWREAVKAHGLAARAAIIEGGEAAESAATQALSLRFSLNQEVLGLTYEDNILVMGQLLGLVGDLPPHLEGLAAQHAQRTQAVTPRYIAVNHALRSQDLTGRAAQELTGHPEHLRLTVHAKAGEPRPILHQSATLARPALLPMHGVARRIIEKQKPRVVGLFDLEARLEGLRPVSAPDSQRTLYFES